MPGLLLLHSAPSRDAHGLARVLSSHEDRLLISQQPRANNSQPSLAFRPLDGQTLHSKLCVYGYGWYAITFNAPACARWDGPQDHAGGFHIPRTLLLCLYTHLYVDPCRRSKRPFCFSAVCGLRQVALFFCPLQPSNWSPETARCPFSCRSFQLEPGQVQTIPNLPSPSTNISCQACHAKDGLLLEIALYTGRTAQRARRAWQGLSRSVRRSHRCPSAACHPLPPSTVARRA